MLCSHIQVSQTPQRLRVERVAHIRAAPRYSLLRKTDTCCDVARKVTARREGIAACKKTGAATACGLEKKRAPRRRPSITRLQRLRAAISRR